MKTNTGLLALGLFTLAGVVTISCGGSSDDTTNSGNTSGSTSTAGTTSTGGTTSTAGTSTTGAGTSSTAGTTSTAGTSSGGTTSNGGTANGGNANGGNANGGRNNNGGNTQNAGGDNAGPTCPATQPPANTACMRGDGGFLGCTYGDQTCRCQRGQNNMRTWVCQTTQNPGAGGDNGGFGQATCPDNAKNGDTCTNGPGLCTGQQCFCNNQGMVQCF